MANDDSIIKRLFTRFAEPGPAAAASKPARYRSNASIGAEVAAAYNPDKPYLNWSGKNKWLRAYNPDDLVKSKGQGVKIYQDMIREPFVKAALQQKKTALLSVPWGVKPASLSPDHVAQARFVGWSMKNLKGGFGRDIWEACDALNNGYALQEKVYGIVPFGEWKGKITFTALKSKNPYYFDFDTDEFDNLTPDGVVMSQAADGRTNVPLEAAKFFIFSYNKLYENLFGSSDLRAAYRAFWIKNTAWKLRAVYMERFSGNALKGKYPRNKDAAANKADLLDIFRAWQNETGVAIPEDLEIEVMQIATSSDSEYSRAMSDCNKEIAISILGETLTVDEGRKTGARNMGEIHAEVVDLLVLHLDMVLTADINEQIVRELVDMNWAEVEAYPEFYWYPREDYDPVQFGDAVQKWQGAGAEVSKAWFYERTRMPLPSGPEDVLKPTAAAAPSFPSPAPSPQPSPARGEGEIKEPLPSEGEVGASRVRGGSEASPAKMAEPSPTPANGKGKNGYRRELSRWESFAEIPKVDKRLMRLTDKAIEISRPAYEKIFADILKQVEKKNVLASKDFAAAAKIAVNPGPLKDVFFKTLLTGNMLGRADAVVGCQNQGFDFGRIRKFAEAGFDWTVLDEPFTPEEAVKFFSGKVPMTRAEFDALAAKLMDQAFYVTGLDKLSIERDVKQLLTDALANGMTPEEFKFKLQEMQVKYSTPVYGREGTVGEAILDYHADTVFRTNLMSSYNEGRRELYGDEDVKAYFPAYEYTAIMDGRTTEICEALDGQIYLADDPIWNKIWPPNHFSCRSTVVTVNKYDFDRDMLSEKPKVVPAEGFGG